MTLKSIAFMFAACWALAAAPAAAEDINRLQVSFGSLNYQFYCMSCHGADGKGDGPVAAALATHPADLTLLAKRNGGKFPAEKVAAAIDGRLDVVGHLDLAMPPWGELFTHELEAFPSGEVVEAMVSRRIAHILSYLASIQEK